MNNIQKALVFAASVALLAVCTANEIMHSIQKALAFAAAVALLAGCNNTNAALAEKGCKLVCDKQPNSPVFHTDYACMKACVEFGAYYAAKNATP